MNADIEQLARIQSLTYWVSRRIIASGSFSIPHLRPSEFIRGF
jgi:hypothetical protein